MKKLILIFLIIIYSITILFASTISGGTFKEDSKKNLLQTRKDILVSSHSTLVPKVEEFDVYFKFYNDRMPEKWVEAFLKATKDRKELRSTLYSMMLLESQLFTQFENHDNSNGTSDYGPLMLNSANIRSTEFKEVYYPKNDFFVGLTNTTKDEYTVYMIACINLFIAHMDTYKMDGEKQLSNSLRAYNAGPKILKAERWNRRVAKSFAYSKKVQQYLSLVDRDFKVFDETVKKHLDSRFYKITYN